MKCNAYFIGAQPISLGSDSNCNPRNTLCKDACPDGFLIGVVKIFAFLELEQK